LRQDLRFPRGGGDFITLQLADDLQHAVGAMKLRTRGHMLPAAEEIVEVQRGDGFDFAPQLTKRCAMNAGKHTAVTPLDLASGGWLREAATKGLAFGLQVGERNFHILGIEGEAFGECGNGGWPGTFHPATQDRDDVFGEDTPFGG
jgi:hypothetical protein